ncbi:MAG TPA: hypothetical protein VGN72_20465 [Tepidisphaeraceae bacterium]|nr:hypothetical protein [Tepidisphaeraceae bacterium]
MSQCQRRGSAQSATPTPKVCQRQCKGCPLTAATSREAAVREVASSTTAWLADDRGMRAGHALQVRA